MSLINHTACILNEDYRVYQRMGKSPGVVQGMSMGECFAVKLNHKMSSFEYRSHCMNSLVQNFSFTSNVFNALVCLIIAGVVKRLSSEMR